MTTQADYTPEEWWLLKETPLRVGAAVMVAADSGKVGTLHEIVSNAAANAEAVQDYPNNELLRALLNPDAQATFVPLPPAQAGANRSTRQDELKSNALDKCRQVAGLLKQKSSQVEADEYKAWILKIGEKVAGAAQEGGVFGIGAKTISPEEVLVLQNVAEALSVGSYTPPESK